MERQARGEEMGGWVQFDLTQEEDSKPNPKRTAACTCGPSPVPLLTTAFSV